jgi:uncharacterized membrane protein
MKLAVAALGGGPGGYPATIRAAHLGAHAACNERAPELGATRLRIRIPAKSRAQTAPALKQTGRGRHNPRRRVATTGTSRREPDPTDRDPARVIALSDAVIAIAVTLLVLEIRPPQDTGHLLHGLAALWPSYATYVITFMLVGQVWANHHVMFDHIRHADRLVLFLNTVLLMDIAFLPFAAAVLAHSFRDGQGERAAVVLHGIAFGLAAALFNAIWWHARHHHRLLAGNISPAGVRAISRRFQLALAWIGTGTLLGALVPALGVAVIAAFIVYYWLPISGETGRQPRTGRSARPVQRGTRLTSSAKRPRKTSHRAPAS